MTREKVTPPDSRARCRVCGSTHVRGMMSPAYGYSLICDECSFVRMGVDIDYSPHFDGPCTDFNEWGNCARCYATYLARRAIKPALTAEEWRTVGSDEIEPLADRLRDAAAEATLPPHDITRHSLAALCLAAQPFGFTKKDVTALDDAAESLQGYATEEVVRSIRDKIAALLPP